MNLESLIGSQAYDDMCEEFVEQAQGSSQKYANAITAWTNQQNNAVQGLGGVQPGDTIYFSPNEGNGYNGHTGIYMGNNQFLSATDYGVATNDINNWSNSTGQQILGYIPQNNPQLASQLSQLPANDAGSGGAGPAGGPDSAIYGQLVQAQSQEAAQQKWQQEDQEAQTLSGWLQGYEQQNAQNAMGRGLPSTSLIPQGAMGYMPTTGGQTGIGAYNS